MYIYIYADEWHPARLMKKLKLKKDKSYFSTLHINYRTIWYSHFYVNTHVKVQC